MTPPIGYNNSLEIGEKCEGNIQNAWKTIQKKHLKEKTYKYETQ